MATLFFDYPSWFLLACIAVGFVLAGLMYYRNNRLSEWSTIKKGLLFGLRFLAGSIIAFLLLSPYLKTRKHEVVKPAIVIATDNSSSMSFTADSMVRQRISEQLDLLRSSLDDDFTVEQLTFGEEIAFDTPLGFDELESDMSEALDYIYDKYKAEELGGVVLLSDGIYNKGFNPLYSAEKFISPIITVGFGDTTISRDIIVKNVLSNDIAFLHDKFPIRVDIQAINLRGNSTKVKLFQLEDGKRINKGEHIMQIESQDQFNSFDFIVDASTPGVNHFRIYVDYLAEESIRVNNSKDLYIDVIDGSQKVLIYTQAPHPDIGTIKKSLTSNKNYKVDIRYTTDPPPAWRDYDLVIFNQLPNTTYSLSPELAQINRYATPRIFILGSQTSVTDFNKAQSIVHIGNSGAGYNHVLALYNTHFTEFVGDDHWATQLINFPPLQSPFGEYQLSPKSSVLFKQKIGSVDTEYPLVAFNSLSAYKEGAIMGEGLWKWRLNDFIANENHAGFDELLSKIIQYSTIKDDRRRFRSEVGQSIYNQNDAISFKAELYNKSLEAINNPEAFLSIKDLEGNEFEYVYNKTNSAYEINIGNLPVGQYRATSSCSENGESLMSYNKFSIQPIQLEAYSTTADHALLKQIAQSTKGIFLQNSELSKAASFIKNHEQIKPIIYSRNTTIPLLHVKWLLGLLIALLAIEWIIRKYSGTY